MVAQVDKVYKDFGFSRVLRRFFCYLVEGRPLTTKGRFINPLARVFLRIFSMFFSGDRLESPIYILGMGRSGTTFLGNALSVHPAVAYFNEPKLMWSMAFPADDIVGNYVAQEPFYRMDSSFVSPDGRRAIRSMYALCAAITRSPRIVDKYPEMIFRLPFLAEIFPDARFVAIVRNGNNVIRSVASWNKSHIVNGHGFQESWWGLNDRKWRLICDELIANHHYFSRYSDEIRKINNDFERSAIEWVLTMEEIVALRAHQAENLFVIKYEDLIDSPAAQVKNILGFCNLTPDGSVLEYIEKKVTVSADRSDASSDLPDYIQAPFKAMMIHFGYQ